MGIKALTWAFDAPLETGPKFVLIALAEHASDHSGEDWTCYPSVDRITQMTGMSRSTVERHLKTLEGDFGAKGSANGWITRKRRVRPDGRLGIYDYTLRKSKLEEVQKATAEGTEPHVNLTHGPGVNLTDAMRQIEGKPHVNLTHEEPSLEPSLEPQTGGREPGDDGFEEAWASFAEVGRRRSSPPAARSAWAKACDLVEGARLLAAIQRFAAEDADVRRGVCPSLQRWLADERWRYWLSEGRTVEADASSPRTGFVGPAELRARIKAVRGETFVVSYLDPATWDDEAKILTPYSVAGAQKLAEVRHIIREFGASIGAPVTAVRAAGGKA